MKKVVLLVVIAIIYQSNSASEPPLSFTRENRSPDGYNPFREGLDVVKIFNCNPQYFFTYYEEVKPTILQFLGPEISNFCQTYPESTISAVIHRYLYAVTARLLAKREGSRKIDVVHHSIPAHYNELKQILNVALTIEYTSDHDKLHQELDNYLEVVRTHARNHEKNRITFVDAKNRLERTAHENASHYPPA